MSILNFFDLLLSSPITFILLVLILVGPLLISITIHEWAHGFVAYKFGDPTPKNQGRLTLNPLAHIDPVGAIMLFLTILIFQAGIGWAKPVEINPNNINSRFKLMLVAFAGPLSNFTFAVILCIIFVFLPYVYWFFKGNLSSYIFVLAGEVLHLIIRINLVLGLFNLIPLPPLDGANIISNLLPEKIAEIYFRIAPYSIPILLLIIISNGLKFIFSFAQTIEALIIFGLHKIFSPLINPFIALLLPF